ncbi:MAG: hypothetical protein AAF600_16820 [Bacteroidota bacterium]
MNLPALGTTSIAFFQVGIGSVLWPLGLVGFCSLPVSWLAGYLSPGERSAAVLILGWSC